MKSSWIFFIGRRYLAAKRREKGLSASLLPILGIAVGVMTLTTVLGVMNGFQLSFIESILEVSSHHLRIESVGGKTVEEGVLARIRSLPEVRSLTSFVSTQTLIAPSEGAFINPVGALVRGVEPDVMEKDPGFREHVHLQAGTWDLGPGKIVVGSELARILGVQMGDSIQITALSGPQFSLLRPQQLPFTITGIFKSGYYDFDRSWVFVELAEALEHLARPQDLVYGIKLKDYFQDEVVAPRIEALLDSGDFRVVSWRTYNAAFFGALKMEKTVMMILIGLIFLVVGINIYLSLQRSVWERREDLGLLKAVGAHSGQIQGIFLAEGAFVGLVGGWLGTALGLWAAAQINGLLALLESGVNVIMGWIQGLSGMDRMSSLSLFTGSAFYIPRIPSRVLWPEVWMVFLFGVLAGALAAWFASRRILKLRAAAVLRAE